MPDGTVTVSGETVHTWERGAGDNQEYVRTARITAVTLDEWPLSTTARATPIAALASRLSVIFYNDSDTNTAFLRFDATNPTTTSHSLAIRPRQVVTLGGDWAPQIIRMVSDGSSGTLHITLGDGP